MQTWRQSGVDYDFYYLKGVIEELMAELKIADVEYKACKDNSIYHPGRAAYLYVQGQKAGVFGELHPTIADNYGIDDRVYIAEIDVDILIAAGTGAIQVKPLPKFPAATRDMEMCIRDRNKAAGEERSEAGISHEEALQISCTEAGTERSACLLYTSRCV